MPKVNKSIIDLSTPADDLDYDPLAVSKKVDVNINKSKGRKKPPVDYKKISRDFIKTDRNILDVCVPYLIDKYSSGTAMLYIMLYRLSYGFRKNKISINDDDLARRTGIPKRTLATYRKSLEECDMIHFDRGYKTTKKPTYTILLPEQSLAFKNILQKTANNLQKKVKSSDDSIIYKNIDKHSNNITELVREFYRSIGKTEHHLTRRLLNDGERTIQSLIAEGYEYETIKGCIKYTLALNKEIYSITFLNYTIGDYIVEQLEEKKRKKALAEEQKKNNERNKKLALENHLKQLYSELPGNEQNTMMYKAEELAHNYMIENKIKYGERFIISNYLHELLQEKFSDVVRSWN